MKQPTKKKAERRGKVKAVEELATLKKRAETANRNSRPSEPTEGDVERAVNIFFAADADSNKSMRRVLEWWSNRLSHLRSKP